jgi:TonB family protein
MKAFKFLVVILAVAVGVSGFNADAKKRKTRKRKAKTTVVEPAPYNYDYVEGSCDNDEVLEQAKYMPEYPGGTDGLVKFLAENINYPEKAKKNKVQGTVLLQFVIEKDGSLSDVKVLRSVDKDLDAEALRVVKQITRFVPGYNEDHAPVRVLYTLPIKFKL